MPVDDINQAEQVYGTATALKKNVTKKSNPHLKSTKIPLPLPNSQKQRDLNMFMDIFMTTK